MMKCKFYSRMICSLLGSVFLATTVGCGGGGGGGGGGGETSVPRGIRVLHGAIDATPVELYSSERPGVLLQEVAFASSQSYVSLPKGLQTITLQRAKTPSVVLRAASLDLQERQKYTLLLYGDNGNFGLSTRFIEDTLPEDQGSGAMLRFVDGMTGAAEVQVSAGLADQPRSSAVSTRVGYGLASNYLQVPAGTVRVVAQRAADSKVLTSSNFQLQQAAAYTVLIAGEADYYVKALLLRD